MNGVSYALPSDLCDHFSLLTSNFSLSSHPPPHHTTGLAKSDALEECAVLDAGYKPLALHRCRHVRELVQHDASDPFAAQLFGDDESRDADRARFERHRQHRDELANEFADEG